MPIGGNLEMQSALLKPTKQQTGSMWFEYRISLKPHVKKKKKSNERNSVT